MFHRAQRDNGGSRNAGASAIHSPDFPASAHADLNHLIRRIGLSRPVCRSRLHPRSAPGFRPARLQHPLRRSPVGASRL